MEIELLKKKKTNHDLLIDLFKILVITKKNKNGKYKRVGMVNLSDILGVSLSKCNACINFGVKRTETTLIKNLKDAVKIFKIPQYKRVSMLFTRNSFSQKAFTRLFKNVKQQRLKKDEYFLGRTGLNMKFGNGYTIPNYIVSTYDKKEIKSCIKKLGINIQKEIRKFQSLIEFYMTFLSVRKIETKKL